MGAAVDDLDFGAVHVDDVERWFGGYLDTYAACGRGEEDAASLLRYYAVPLLLTTDTACDALPSAEKVVASAQLQIDGMLAAEYHHSVVLRSGVTTLNATSALYQGTFSRVRADASEINRLTVTYLIADGPDGIRIAALVVHTA